MHRRIAFAAALVLAACNKPAERSGEAMTSPSPGTSAAAPQGSPRDALLAKHRELFTFIGLSPGAVDELLGKVAWVHDGIQNQARANPEAVRALQGVVQRGNPQNLEEAMTAHRGRFAALGLTAGTQAELERAFAQVYQDLHGTNPSARALKVRELMSRLPPCCDDNIFRRAGATP